MFIRHIWFNNIFPYYLLLLPFSWLYGFVSYIIRLSFKYGIFKVYRFPLSVVVIGNLTIGGNGKTPMVLWLVRQLKHRGWNVGVVSRGYGGRSQRYPIILDKNSNTDECGDEPILIWQRTNVPVAVSPCRTDAVAKLLKTYPLLDIIISDDGLQHYSLARDIEWVVVNSEYRFGNGCLLPAGPMREKLNRLNTVQQVIFSGNHVMPSEISMRVIPVAIVNILTKERRLLNTILSDVVAMAGIAHPSQFFSTLHMYGVIPIKEVSFSDHQIYSENVLDRVAEKHELLLMTEKDAVKCCLFAHDNWWYLEVEAVLSQQSKKLLIRPIEKNILKYKKHIFNNHI
ncbi:tetraacyldisaccharide 4'-kinase [Blochmannia endosymbiont of Polyrhachis (Hedomyrma) turneri]|uniref:tetraacyldisaccharide 4'-kinase n=1 Tax=Blochmannia endosymbiont of Polyrhachis (Hedomyrma) turneri TaxID=1505596 RepID=UPI00061A68CF|nr:tetraacyldisaccharide 4'-kinase [Blochmannia endosymbiont of Polyrhachis (Hedomyrma) turneri]AKC59944.1 Tetraacyldisaccharide 4'-kinase [Blochmannia endosymbiont of Polyrhachis (Hedomyrma) turneri]